VCILAACHPSCLASLHVFYSYEPSFVTSAVTALVCYVINMLLIMHVYCGMRAVYQLLADCGNIF